MSLAIHQSWSVSWLYHRLFPQNLSRVWKKVIHITFNIAEFIPTSAYYEKRLIRYKHYAASPIYKPVCGFTSEERAKIINLDFLPSLGICLDCFKPSYFTSTPLKPV